MTTNVITVAPALNGMLTPPATEVVEPMAQSLTGDLKKAGVDARRVTPAEPLPRNGRQMRGVFPGVDAGNRQYRSAAAATGRGALAEMRGDRSSQREIAQLVRRGQMRGDDLAIVEPQRR